MTAINHKSIQDNASTLAIIYSEKASHTVLLKGRRDSWSKFVFHVITVEMILLN